MSVQALSWVLDNSKAEHAARLVLISIANHCDKYGRNAWPSVASVGKESLLSERVVRFAMRKLEIIGELAVEFGGGPHRTNLYSLPKMCGAYSAPAHIAPAEFVKEGQNSSEMGAEFVGAIRKNRPKPSLEPSSVREFIFKSISVILTQQKLRKESVGVDAGKVAHHLSVEYGHNIPVSVVEEAIAAHMGATA